MGSTGRHDPFGFLLSKGSEDDVSIYLVWLEDALDLLELQGVALESVHSHQ